MVPLNSRALFHFPPALEVTPRDSPNHHQQRRPFGSLTINIQIHPLNSICSPGRHAHTHTATLTTTRSVSVSRIARIAIELTPPPPPRRLNYNCHRPLFSIHLRCREEDCDFAPWSWPKDPAGTFEVSTDRFILQWHNQTPPQIESFSEDRFAVILDGSVLQRNFLCIESAPHTLINGWAAKVQSDNIDAVVVVVYAGRAGLSDV